MCSGQRQEIVNNFRFYIKFNVAHVTSESEAKNSNHTNQPPHANSNDPANLSSINWFRNINSIQRHDIENRFFIFGLFFLNGASNTQPASTLNEDSTCQQPHPAASNRLVFFLFNCVPDNIKQTLINTHSNTYLIRKSLFSTQKIAQKSNSGSSASVGSSSNNLNINSGSDLASKVVFADSYRFYCNKNAQTGGSRHGHHERHVFARRPNKCEQSELQCRVRLDAHKQH